MTGTVGIVDRGCYIERGSFLGTVLFAIDYFGRCSTPRFTTIPIMNIIEIA